MDSIRLSILSLERLLKHGTALSEREKIEVRAELEYLQAEFKKLERYEKEHPRGVSRYGAYFST